MQRTTSDLLLLKYRSLPSLLCLVLGTWVAGATERELIRDPHFQRGFFLLEPAPGKRVVYGAWKGLSPGQPAWDLAQWSSRFPLQPEDGRTSEQAKVGGNRAKTLVLGAPGTAEADLSLAVHSEAEYPQARKSSSEPWVHLLVQQELQDPPALAPLRALNFRLEVRLKRSTLADPETYSPALHAAQFLVYLTVANRNSHAAGYQECFWFGIPVYDNRERIVSNYEAQDFGDTKLFIFTPASDNFARTSTHDGEWVTFQKDLLPLVRRGIQQAHAKRFLKGSSDPSNFRPLGIFIGWEIPGKFNVEMQIRNLSLRAAES